MKRQSNNQSGLAQRNARRRASSADSTGLASIVVVFMLVIVVSLMSLGFAKLMDRATQQALGNNLASAAEYAARAGINEAIAYVKTNPSPPATPECDTLIKPGQPLATTALSSLGDTKVTCLLIDASPLDVAYQNITPNKSQLVGFVPANGPRKIMVSWQSHDRAKNQFVPDSAGQQLFNETEWGSNNYAPVLRLALYPVRDDNRLNDIDSDSRVFFLYPKVSSGGSVTAFSYDTKSGSLISVKCSNPSAQPLDSGSFVGSADYDCNAVIDGMNASKYKKYIIRITPMYAAADVKFKANDASGQAINFNNMQYVIDVTARSGNAVKRLQARVESSATSAFYSVLKPDANNLPEQALRVAQAVCKRFVVDTSANAVTIEADASVDCVLPPPPPPPPPTNWTAPGALPQSNYAQSSNNDEPCGSGRYVAYAYLAADGKMDSCYDARTNTQNPAWWRVNLGQQRHIEKILLHWTQSDYTFPFNLQGSSNSDCSNWNNIRTNISRSPSPVTLAGLNVDYRCIRLITTGNQSMRVAEIEIWNR